MRISTRSRDEGLAKFPETCIDPERGFNKALSLFKDFMRVEDTVENSIQDLINTCLNEVPDHKKDDKPWVYSYGFKDFGFLAKDQYIDRINEKFELSRAAKEGLKEKLTINVSYTEEFIDSHQFNKTRTITKKVSAADDALFIVKQDFSGFTKSEILKLKNVENSWKLGRITELAGKETSVIFDAIDLVSENSETKDIWPIDFAYARNSIDSQGLMFDKSYILLTPDLDQAELYVIMTRSSGKLGGKRGEQTNEILVSVPKEAWLSIVKEVKSDGEVLDMVIEYGYADTNREARRRLDLFQ